MNLSRVLARASLWRARLIAILSRGVVAALLRTRLIAVPLLRLVAIARLRARRISVALLWLVAIARLRARCISVALLAAIISGATARTGPWAALICTVLHFMGPVFQREHASSTARAVAKNLR